MLRSPETVVFSLRPDYTRTRGICAVGTTAPRLLLIIKPSSYSSAAAVPTRTHIYSLLNFLAGEAEIFSSASGGQFSTRVSVWRGTVCAHEREGARDGETERRCAVALFPKKINYDDEPPPFFDSPGARLATVYASARSHARIKIL